MIEKSAHLCDITVSSIACKFATTRSRIEVAGEVHFGDTRSCVLEIDSVAFQFTISTDQSARAREMGTQTLIGLQELPMCVPFTLSQPTHGSNQARLRLAFTPVNIPQPRR